MYNKVIQIEIFFMFFSIIGSVSSVTQSCLILFDPIDWRQVSLSITNSQSLLKLMTIELVMPSNHLILCRPLLLLPSIFPSIRVFSNESALHIIIGYYMVLNIVPYAIRTHS